MTHKDAFDRGYKQANDEWKARVQEVFSEAKNNTKLVAETSNNTLGGYMVSILLEELEKELLSSGKEK